MINEAYKYSELTGIIIGCAMEVHSTLGNGFQEVIYQRALEIEFNSRNICYRREHNMPIHYKGTHIGTRHVDFLAEDLISVELKAVIELQDVHFGTSDKLSGGL